MKIFLSHNSKDKDLAETLAVALRNEGHGVFFDKTDLPLGESFDRQIRDAIGQSDLFLFLASPDAVAAGVYALTELKFAQEKWPSPSNHVLSVMARAVDDSALPPYLRNVTYLRPQGNLVAETVAAVKDIENKLKLRRIFQILAVLPVLLFVAAFFFRQDLIDFFKPEQPSFLKGKITPADIVVSHFDGEDADLRISRQIETAIEKELNAKDIRSVSIEILDEPIKKEAQAREAVAAFHAKAVIWGWRDKARINIRIAVSSLIGKAPSKDQDIGMIDILPNDRDLSVVATKLQEAAKTTALYVVGQLFYSGNDYGSGHKAMDAAMKSLPDDASVIIENTALVEFLKGRQSFEEGAYAAAVAHYVAAIDANPNLAAAYNNLAILYAKLQYLSWSEETFKSEPEGASDRLDEKIRKSALSKMASWDNPPEQRFSVRGLFEKARKIEPDNEAIHFNELASSWREVHVPESGAEDDGSHPYPGKDIDTTEWKKESLKIVEKDPSIIGPHLMLGAIAFDEGNCAEASKRYSTAAELAPESSKIHNDLGLSRFCEGNYPAARSELQLALDLMKAQKGASEDYYRSIEANAINVLLKLGEIKEARKLIDKRLSSASAKDDRQKLDVAILSAIAYFNENNVKSFERALERARAVVSKEPEYGLDTKYRIPPLDRLLAAWALETEGKTAESASLLRKLSADIKKRQKALEQEQALEPTPTRGELLRLQFPVALTWLDLALACGNPKDPRDWTGANCLPSAPRERIRRVLDMYQERLAKNIFYRVEVYYGGLLCPYVYTFEPSTGAWKFDTPILTNRRGRTAEGFDTKILHEFHGRLLIAEKERETSFIDQIYVTIEQADGREIRLQPKTPAIAYEDGDYLVLKRGDSAIVEFETPAKAAAVAAQYIVTAKGYYIPDRVGRSARRKLAPVVWTVPHGF